MPFVCLPAEMEDIKLNEENGIEQKKPKVKILSRIVKQNCQLNFNNSFSYLVVLKGGF
jgi:hypothetical protein